MLLTHLNVENFGCLRQKSTFNFKAGLNYVAAANGHGKSTLLAAIKWLARGDDEAFYYSAKAFLEMVQGADMTVLVEGRFQQDDHSFLVVRKRRIQKGNDNVRIPLGEELLVFEEKPSGERELLKDPQRIINTFIFPGRAFQYTFFEGEEQLKVFENSDTLPNLISATPEMRILSGLHQDLTATAEHAEAKFISETKKRSKNKRILDQLDEKIEAKKKEKAKASSLLADSQEKLESLEDDANKIVSVITTAEDLEKLKDRQRKCEDNLRDANNRVRRDLVTPLFDDKWILRGFGTAIKSLEQKIELAVKQRSLEEQEFFEKRGEVKGSIKQLREVVGLDSSSHPLRVDVPSRSVMEELIAREHCLVCNTPAPEGSEALKYMKQRLTELEHHESPKPHKQETPFPEFVLKFLEKYISLKEQSLGFIGDLDNTIAEDFKFSQTQRQTAAKFENEKTEIQEEIAALVGGSSKNEDSLSEILLQWQVLQNDLGDEKMKKAAFDQSLSDTKDTLQDLIEKRNSAVGNTSIPASYQIARDVSEQLRFLFEKSKDSKLNQILGKIENRANEVFEQINPYGYRGEIKLQLSKTQVREQVSVAIQNHPEVTFDAKVNKSVTIAMHISILLAVSEFYSGSGDSPYPVVLDAPVSSFDANKVKDFYRALQNIQILNGQIFLISYHFVNQSNSDKSYSIEKDIHDYGFDSIHWINHSHGIDSEDISTVESTVTKIS